MEKCIPKKLLILYCLIFFLSWTVVEFFIKPQIGLYFGIWGTTLIKSGLIKTIVWVLPCILLIKIYGSFLFVNIKEMFTNKVTWLKYLPILVLFVLYILVISYVKNGEVGISGNFTPNLILIALFAGVTEEIVFRGWLLNVMLQQEKMKFSIFINAILFLVIHFPRWIYEGIWVQYLLNGGFFSIMILSFIFSISFIKSKNIFVPIILHTIWNLLIFLLI